VSKNKYRSQSLRLQHWDYADNAAYFITVCTQNKACYFGAVVEGVMALSPLGVLADVLWYEINNHTDYVELAGFVVMPNHIHGIIIINNPDCVETRHALSTATGNTRLQNQGKTPFHQL